MLRERIVGFARSTYYGAKYRPLSAGTKWGTRLTGEIRRVSLPFKQACLFLGSSDGVGQHRLGSPPEPGELG